MKNDFKETVNKKFDEIVKDPSYISKPVENKKTFPLWAKIAIPAFVGSVATFSLIVILIPPMIRQSPLMEEISSFKMDPKSFTKNDIDNAHENEAAPGASEEQFVCLTDFKYPTEQGNFFYSEEEFDAYLNFAYQFSKANNYESFSPVSLYSVLHALDYGISDNELKTLMDDLLGLDIDSQTEFYQKVFRNNFYITDDGTIQMYNGAFFNNSEEYTYSNDYIDYLGDNYYEAYSLNFKNNLNPLIDWVNKALMSNNFVDKEFLDLKTDTALYLFSTLYFDHYWQSKYISDNNIVKDFYLNSVDKVEATYMKHSFMTDCLFEYEDYVSFSDKYSGGATITYLVPKVVENNILDIVKDKNFLIEDEEHMLKVDPENGIYSIYVNLTTPKFETKYDSGLKNALVSLGFEKMFDDDYNTLANCFVDPTNSYNFYLQNVKQRNQIKFNEDGSLLKILVAAQVGAGGAAAPGDAFDGEYYFNIELNQPFIYIIKDRKGLPLFIGYMDNPLKK